ncbi:polyketide cyclase [Meiothermus phage MMP7]|nr:polyketide cyclase [Meiothermus phage MMP7]
MARRVKQIAPGLSVVKTAPFWRGDDRVYEFIHEPTGAVLCCGSPPLWRFKRRVVELAEPQLALLDWTNLDPDDPLNYPIYRDEFYRIIRESLERARAEEEETA